MFLALVIHHEKRMRGIVLSSVACPALPYFSTFYNKGHGCGVGGGGEEVVECKICVWIFCKTLSEILLILRRIKRCTIIHIRRL